MFASGRTRGRVSAAAAVGAAAAVSALLLPNAFADADLTWTNTEVSNPDKSTALYGVDAVAKDDAWAVGYRHATGEESVITHWDGEKWTEVEHPKTGYLSAVDSGAADNVWAVGQDSEDENGRAHGYAVHWDGKEWKEIKGPDLGTDASYLDDVSAAADGTVWAGGVMTNEPEEAAPAQDPERFLSPKQKAGGWKHFGFVQRWDGTEWTVMKPPVPEGAENVQVNNIAAVSADEVWATGFATVTEDGGRSPRPWIARYSGGEWSTVEIPAGGAEPSGYITGITPTGDGKFAMVGHAFDGETPVPMVLNWNGEKLSRQDFAEIKSYIFTGTSDGQGGLLLGGGTGADGQAPSVLRYDGGELTATTAPETDEYALLSGLAVVPGTSQAWAVGANTTVQGVTTGPFAAHTELD